MRAESNGWACLWPRGRYHQIPISTTHTTNPTPHGSCVWVGCLLEFVLVDMPLSVGRYPLKIRCVGPKNIANRPF